MTDAPTTEDPTAEPPPAETPVESDPAREALVDQLRAQFGDAIIDTYIGRGDLWVRVSNEKWHDVVAFCKNVLNLRWFDFLSGLDWLNNQNLSGEKTWDFDATREPPALTEPGYTGGEGRFQVMLRAKNIETNVGLTLKADLDDENPTIGSVVDVYAGAEWHERETWEMFGFNFDGHPGLRHLYLPGGFEGHPLRKDFPLLAREIKPWPGLVDKEPMPGEEAEGEEAEGSGE
jgi:NADH-quinone oxidoreductase subunit C